VRALLVLLVLLVGVSTALGADERSRAVKEAALPGASTIVVVAEGEFEPRSVGSYSLRVYGGTNPRFAHDDFIAGMVRPRDGTVEEVRFADLDGDGVPEIVVVMRSAGTGGYLSADGFRLHGKVLALITSVAGLASNADPIQALKARLANP
jgi:Periplasmic lysozyme inhibitor of I-type lysozyme